MTRCLLALWLLWIYALPAVAQDIPVRSGEHGAFTRLVLDIPLGAQWTLVRPEGRQAEIVFDRGGYQFDLSAAFDRIGNDRVAGLTPLPQGRGLRVALGCDCAAEAFLLRGRMLVIDIRPGEPSPVVAASPPGAFSEIRVGREPGIGPQRAENTLLPTLSLPVSPEPEGTVVGTPELDPGAFEHMLAEQLATAATEGLLDPALHPLPDPPAAVDVSPDARDPQSVPKTGDPASALMSAIERTDPYDRQTRIRIGGTTCISDAELDVAAWGDDTTFEEAIPQLRARLYGEFDKLDRETLIALTKAYIHLGFGAEARALLALDPELQAPVLVALAGIVDGFPDRAGVFAGQTGCDGAAALWALAGSIALPKGADINDKAIRRSFENLPLDLRALLGPPLSTRLAEEGRPEAARDLLAQLARATGVTNEDMTFSAARIDRLEGAVDEAQKVLNEIAARPGPLAPDAVAQAIEIAAEQGGPVGQRMTALSAAYATELRETGKGPELWLAHLRALIANGDFDAAFEMFAEAPGGPDEMRKTAVAEALGALTGKAPDTAFLKQAVAQADRFDGLATQDTALAVAGRLLDLGLPDEAARWATFIGIDRAARDVRLLNARIHLARSEPEEAEIALIGLQGDDSLALRAEARRMIGDFDYASGAYASLGAPQEARNAAWLAGDWSALEGQDDPLAAAAALLKANLPEQGSGVPSLASVEMLAGSGAASRNTLQALLEETRLPAD